MLLATNKSFVSFESQKRSKQYFFNLATISELFYPNLAFILTNKKTFNILIKILTWEDLAYNIYKANNEKFYRNK